MRKCPICGSLDFDEETACGICGTIFSEFKHTTHAQSSHPVTRLSLRVKKALGFLSGGVIVLLALFLFTTTVTGSIIGFIALLVGVSAMIASASSFKRELGPPRTLNEFAYRRGDLLEIEEEERRRKKAEEQVSGTAEPQETEDAWTDEKEDGN